MAIWACERLREVRSSDKARNSVSEFGQLPPTHLRLESTLNTNRGVGAARRKGRTDE